MLQCGVNGLANSCLFTHLTDAQQHLHSFEVVFGNLENPGKISTAFCSVFILHQLPGGRSTDLFKPNPPLHLPVFVTLDTVSKVSATEPNRGQTKTERLSL